MPKKQTSEPTLTTEFYESNGFWGYRFMLGDQCMEWGYGYRSERSARAAAALESDRASSEDGPGSA